jgi:N-methylhydantoinase B
MTNTLNTPAEAIEMQYPLRVRAFEVLGNGGGGRWRGGGGIVRTIEALADCEGTVLSDRRTTAPYGLAGGGPGGGGADALRAGATSHPLPSKCRFTLGRGQALDVRTPGGGGWGMTQELAG